MAIAIKHALVMVTPDDPAYENNPSDWNAALVLSGLTTDAILYSTSATVLAQDAAFKYSAGILYVPASTTATLNFGTASISGIGSTGTVLTFTPNNTRIFDMNGATGHFNLYTTFSVGWGAGNTTLNPDANISKISAGLLAIGTGAAGSFAGSLKLTNLTLDGLCNLKGYAVASLPAGVDGAIVIVTDQLTTVAAKGVAPTGGGSVHCAVIYNGSAWVGI